MYNTDNKNFINQKEKTLKRNILRYNEYYNIQNIYDNLYKQSKNGDKFTHLYEIITSRENILLAYRTIKRNKGSKTAGINKHNINTWQNVNIENYINYIRNRLDNYKPQPIKRVEIPKPDGKKRPLGIPCIEDRLIQQCIKQVLEPICEAKFYEHSYGFRPNRSTEHAIGYTMKKINIDKNYHIVDVDIKGFFDNVNQGKLLKQLWSIGIQDKKVLSIISSMLKAEIKGIGIPNKGIPQGGILSPLLANVVLNELDWWITNQWSNYKTKYNYKHTNHKYKHLRNSNLKEMYIIRYADDFKICCRKHKDAIKIYQATKQWLKERLSLDINEEKSKIVDVRKQPTNFLGFKLKAYKKNKKWIVRSNMTDKAKEKAIDNIKEQLKYIQNNNMNGLSIQNLNKIIVGLQNYYKLATEVSNNFNEINYKLSKRIMNQFKSNFTKTGYKTKEYQSKYKGYKGTVLNINNIAIYPISYIQNKPPKLFKQKICNYTKEGRKIIHNNLKNIDKEIMNYLLENSVNDNIEINDNRISLYSAQNGKCAISKVKLDETMELHHKIPRSKGGTDEYKNLSLVTYEIHKLIHATNKTIIDYYLKLIKLSKKDFEKLNKYRLYVGNEMIMSE